MTIGYGEAFNDECKRSTENRSFLTAKIYHLVLGPSCKGVQNELHDNCAWPAL